MSSGNRLRWRVNQLLVVKGSKDSGARSHPMVGRDVSYSIERAALLVGQLERLATQNVHQLAGQLANLDFWVAEAAAALHIIEDYPQRFRRLREAQVEWVSSHGTKVSGYCRVCQGACEFGARTPAPPQRTPSDDLARAGEAVRRAMRSLLLRLHAAQLLGEDGVRQVGSQLELRLEPEDFEPS